MRLLYLSACFLIGSAFLGACGETKHSRYNTVAEARSAGLFARGWAPDVLPGDARSIVEAHNLDTNARCLQATLAPDSVAAVASALSRAGFSTSLNAEALQPPEGFCPFSRSAFDGGILWDRSTGERGAEYALLHDDGVFHYWSTGDASR